MALSVDLRASIYVYEHWMYGVIHGTLPRCELSLEQQKQHLGYVYSSRMRQAMAAPYSELEVRALEEINKIVFAPITRHYLLHISREFCVDEYHRMLPHLEGNTNCTGDWPNTHLLKSLCGGSCCHSVLHVESDTVFTFCDNEFSSVRPLHEVLSQPRDDVAERNRYPTLLEYVDGLSTDYPDHYSGEKAIWLDANGFVGHRINTDVGHGYLWAKSCMQEILRELDTMPSNEIALMSLAELQAVLLHEQFQGRFIGHLIGRRLEILGSYGPGIEALQLAMELYHDRGLFADALRMALRLRDTIRIAAFERDWQRIEPLEYGLYEHVLAYRFRMLSPFLPEALIVDRALFDISDMRLGPNSHRRDTR